MTQLAVSDKTSQLLQRFDLSDWRVLEIGPYNGRNTKVLAPRCKEVVCLEPRLENARQVEALGLPNVTVFLGDSSNAISLGRFDLVFHSGVLYHLAEPVKHLNEVFFVSPRLWLNTHYSDGKGQRSDEHNYECYLKGEKVSQPKAGLHGQSRWMTRGSLLRCLIDIGYQVEVVAEGKERHGPRIAIYASHGEKT